MFIDYVEWYTYDYIELHIYSIYRVKNLQQAFLHRISQPFLPLYSSLNFVGIFSQSNMSIKEDRR